MGGLEHANWSMRIAFLALSGTIVASVLLAQRGREMFIRRIPGLTAIEDAVGRATEMGRPILFSPGLDDINIITLQALSILSYIVRLVAAQGTRIIAALRSPEVLPVAEESVREAYERAGRLEDHRADDVRFISSEQFAYALGTVGLMNRERVATNFFFGAFYAESLILAENGRASGALQVAGCPDPVQIPFFIATCDYVVIGDEYYAASAYLTREPTLTGSLVGQDVVKALLLLFVLFGVVFMTATGSASFLTKMLGVGS